MGKEQLPKTAGSASWEAICERCGRCCYEKIDYRDRIFYTNKPCPHLDTEKKLCRVYHQRDRFQPDCVRLTPELVAAGILPDDCPYVRTLLAPKTPKNSPD